METDEDAYHKMKDEAKDLFVRGQLLEALQAYEECVKICAFKDQLVTLHTNMAMCAIKLSRYEDAFAYC